MRRAQTDIITKLGLLDYYDVAWKTSQYGRIWEYLRKDFDVEVRPTRALGCEF